MRKPEIALMPLYDSKKDSYWMLPGYMKGIERAGGVPIMLPLTGDHKILQKLAEQFDGFLFTGGHDVSPALYKAEKSAYCGEICEERDAMEEYLLQKVIELDKPILGICRGIQILNVVLGGTLYQDLPTEMPSDISHHQNPPYDRPVHKVTLEKSVPLFELLQKTTLEVNSYHHQAIQRLASKLESMAYSDDGLIEAVYMPEASFVWAVQWHPEFSYAKDESSFRILKEFVRESSM